METAVAPEIDPWEFRDQLQTFSNEVNRDRLNNWRILDIKLWSTDPRVDRLVEALSLMMWGRTSKRRMDHLRVILMNLVKMYGDDSERFLGYHRGKSRYYKLTSRYNPARITELTMKVIDSLIHKGLVENHPGRFNFVHKCGYVSKLQPTDTLVGIWTAHGIDETLVTSHPYTELLELRAEREVKWSKGKIQKPKGVPVDYVDTPTTIGMRSFLEIYNDAMAGVNLEYKGTIRDAGRTRRIFNGGWKQGGRFYGGFWQGINEAKRSTILINGQPVVELDYGGQHPTIVYARAGKQPRGDVYDIPGIPRDIIKEVSMRALNNKARGHAINGVKQFLEKHQEKYGPVCCAADILESFEAKHHAIKDHFYKGLGLNLLRTDSDICEMVLKVMTVSKIPCLSVFDSFIVPEQHKDCLRKVMVAAFQKITGVDYDPVIK